MIYTGDCIEVMQTLDPDSVDAVVTDPPYGLEFMGKEWDRFAPQTTTARVQRGEGGIRIGDGSFKQGVARISYPSGERPMKCATCNGWSGSFSEARAKRQKKCECEVPNFISNGASSQMIAFQNWCEAWGRAALRLTKPGGYLLAFGGTRTHHRLVCGLEDAGWIIRDELDWIYASGFPKGKANLKPAHEPIVLARKPGPLRPLAIDACRIDAAAWSRQDREAGAGFSTGKFMGSMGNGEPTMKNGLRESTAGRWPSNVLLSDPALFDRPTDYVVGSGAVTTNQAFRSDPESKLRGSTHFGGEERTPYAGPEYLGDSGGYSRFFGLSDPPVAFIVPKADRADREPVLRGQLEEREGAAYDHRPSGDINKRLNRVRQPVQRENSHPTVKPVDLMRHLVRLVTPSGGTVLDCFLGSGSTALAAEAEGFAWVGIEKEPEYVAIAEARLNGVQRGIGL